MHTCQMDGPRSKFTGRFYLIAFCVSVVAGQSEKIASEHVRIKLIMRWTEGGKCEVCVCMGGECVMWEGGRRRM